MARLPQPGGDNGNWGTILNDYLSQGHNADGTVKKSALALTKTDIGLANVDNTSDTGKPVSAAQQAVFDTKAAVSHLHPASQISDSTATGRSVLTATTPVAARAAINTPVSTVGDIINRKVPRATPELWTSFAGKADGAAPTAFDSGQASSIIAVGTGSTPIISGGLLTNNPSGSGNNAFYYQGTLAGIATRIGARFVLSARATGGGTVALAVARTAVPAGAAVPPTMSVHYTITSTGWSFGVWNGPDEPGGDGLTNLLTDTFVTPLVIDGTTEYETEVWLSGSTAIFDTPDGIRHTVTDARIASYGGSIVFFENYSAVPATDCVPGFTHIWASSGPTKAPNNSDVFIPWRIAKMATANSITVLPANTSTAIPDIASDAFNAPPSGKVIVRISAYVHVPTTASVLLQLSIAGASSDFVADYMFENGTGNQRLVGEMVVTDLVPGGAYVFAPFIFSTASDTSLVINRSTAKNASLVIEPIS